MINNWLVTTILFVLHGIVMAFPLMRNVRQSRKIVQQESQVGQFVLFAKRPA